MAACQALSTLGTRGFFPFFVAKLLTVSSEAAIVGEEFKKPWHFFGGEVLQNAPWQMVHLYEQNSCRP